MRYLIAPILALTLCTPALAAFNGPGAGPAARRPCCRRFSGSWRRLFPAAPPSRRLFRPATTATVYLKETSYPALREIMKNTSFRMPPVK